MTTTVPPTTSVSFGIVTELTVDNETLTLILEKIQDRDVTVYRGGMVAGQRLLVVALLAELMPELQPPSSLRSLAITKMAVEFRPDKGAFAFDAAIENVWSVTLDEGPTLSIDRLALSLLSIKPPALKSNSSNLPTTPPANGLSTANPNQLSQQRKLEFVGRSRLFGGELAIKVVHAFEAVSLPSGDRTTASRLRFSATANSISMSEVVKAFGFSEPLYGVAALTISLAFTLDQRQYRSLAPGSQPITQSNYSFRGRVDWDTGIEISAGGETLQITALVQIEKTASNEPGKQQSALTGKIAGIVSASIPFFDTLQLSVIYTFAKTTFASGSSSSASSTALSTRTSELIFQLKISTLLLSAVYTSIPDSKTPGQSRQLLRFSVSLVNGDNPTIGDLIAYIVSLYDPSIIDFELDAPWDEFAQQKISLDKFSLEVDLTLKRVTISYLATLNVLIAKVSNIGLSYQFGSEPATASQAKPNQARTASNKKVAIALNLSIPGQPAQRVQWDPLNENPPAVPGTSAPIFDLQFLALGQRVAFAPEIVQQARTIKQFTDVMRQLLVPLPPLKRRENPLTALLNALPSAVSSDPTVPIAFSGPPIRFSAESSWLIGAQFTIMGAFDLSIIFNDPFIYGIRIELSGPLVQSFAGLEFEILYRRISDTVGVYRTELTLPDAMRQLQFGAVSVTLPTVAIEIYTNGDFGIDVGFPWGGDFSRSVAVEALIFIGVGGFYFNKLSAETATSVPAVKEGTFNPVLEFGIGLKLGLGRTFNKGVLRAEISITLHGLLQGVIAWFNPTDTRQAKATYYRVQGGVAIVGRIYGIVDFKVIQVEVEVIARVGVLFIVEVYKAIQIALVAEVSVRASIKVLFVRIRFSFSLTVRQEFVLGSDSTPPWQLAVASGGAMAASMPVFSAHPRTAFSSKVQAKKQAREPARKQAKKQARKQYQSHSATPLSPHARLEGLRPASVTSSDRLPERPPAQSRTLRWQNGTEDLKLALPKKVRPATVKGDKLRLDLYFQPSFTKTDSGVKGIGLLLIENSIPLDEADQPDGSTHPDAAGTVDHDTDFDELVKALLSWVIYADLSNAERAELPLENGPENEAENGAVRIDAQPLSRHRLEAIYELFVEMLATELAGDFWEPLIGFLSANFIFDVSDRPLSSTLVSGTIFPMFPQLQMTLKPGNDPESSHSDETVIDFDGKRYSQAKIKEIQTYFQARKHTHNLATDGDLQQPVSANMAKGTLAVAELLFIDYFTLIIRSALQMSIDHFKDHNITAEIPLLTLLNELNSAQPFQNLAGMTSRFLLHGLRIPTFEGGNSSSNIINGQEPIYAATGQQFSVTLNRISRDGEGDGEGDGERDLVTTTPNEIKLSKPSGTLDWIRLIDDPIETINSETLTPELNYAFSDELILSIQQINDTTAASLPAALPALLDVYKSIPQSYSIRQKTYWKTATDADKNILWELPLGLVEYLRSKATLPAFILSRQQAQAAGEALEQQPISSSAYQWATKLTLEIRRVASQETRENLPSIYAIERIDTESQQLMRDILSANVQLATMTLLYANESEGSVVLTQQAEARVLLLKTDLSVPSVPTATENRTENSDRYTANLNSDPITFRPFLALLAESSLVNSTHYYLSYTESDAEGEPIGLPERLFATGGDTAKISLVITFVTGPTAYSNCIHMQFDPVNSATAIIAESSEQTQILQIPAGNLGLRLTRAEPIDDPTVATDELQNLYQLLDYVVSDSSESFITGESHPPIGPVMEPVETGETTEETTEEKTEWLYEKVLPVYALTTAPVNSTALPEVLKNTLNPYYGIDAQFELDFQWQDVYGNRLSDRKDKLSQKLGYFDPIVGLNQWPSVGESYSISPGSDHQRSIYLTLALAFDQAKYVPSPNNPFAEALDHIQTDRAVYQQIYYQVHDPNLTLTLSASVIPAWHQDLSRSMLTGFVDSVYRYLVTLESLQALEYSVGEGESLQSIAEKYEVAPEDLADANSAVSSLFRGSSQPIQIPVGMQVKAEDSLWTIASRLVSDRPLSSPLSSPLPTEPPAQPFDAQAQKIAAKALEIVTTYANTTGFIDTSVEPEEAEPHILSVLGGYVVQPEDTFESIAIAQLALAEDTLITTELLSLAQSLDLAEIIADGALIKSLHTADYYVTPNATIATIAYGILQLENADVSQSFDQLLTAKINSIVTANQQVLSAADRASSDGESSIWRDAVLTSEVLAPDTELTAEIASETGIKTVTIKAIARKTWDEFASAFPNSAETPNSIILANAERQDWWQDRAQIAHLGGYRIQAHDSLRHLAINQFIQQDIRATDALKLVVVAEVGALKYPIVEAVESGPSARSLAALTRQLQLQTNRHRTVLETVRAVGNIGDLLTAETLSAQLSRLTIAVSPVMGLFGTQDVVLADVLFDYRLQASDSFNSIIEIAAANAQIITENTTAGAIAAQNPSLHLQPNRQLLIPERFTLNAVSAPQNESLLALIRSPATSVSLETFSSLAAFSGASVAAITIANQTLIGLLNPHAVINVPSVLTTLLSMSAADMNLVSRFVDVQQYSIRPEETLYTLTARLQREAIAPFQTAITTESLQVTQAIGQLSALHEQLTFAKANETALKALLGDAVAGLKSLLFDSFDQLKAPLTVATVHRNVETLDVLGAVNTLENRINANAKTRLAETLQALLQALYRLYEFSALKLAVDLLEQRSPVPITVAEVGNAIAQIPSLIAAEQRWIVPPAMAETTLTIDIGEPDNRPYPSELIFPVRIQLEMRRPDRLMHRDSQGLKAVVPEAEAISAYFPPKTVALAAAPKQPSTSETTDESAVSDRLASLTPFATAFEAALPNLKLAIGQLSPEPDQSIHQSGDTLLAMHLGETGVRYNIQATSPIFFAAAPLTNTLLSGEVSLYSYTPTAGLNQTIGDSMRIESADLNGLARTYLHAIEDILKPETAVPAANNPVTKTAIEQILSVKKRLATAISQQVTHILEPESADGRRLDSDEYAHRQETAATALRQELLKNLADGYDIETIVQYPVEVAIASSKTWPSSSHPAGSAQIAPRLSGQPTITSAYYTPEGHNSSENSNRNPNGDSASDSTASTPTRRTPQADSSDAEKRDLLQTLDFTLSPAKVSLAASTPQKPSTLTFLFNTQTPQRYEDIIVDLRYQVKTLEYNINLAASTSDWLTFVMPLNASSPDPNRDDNHIGRVQIPLPLRDYPLPPALIAHQALPDPDSFASDVLNAENIRDWNYLFLYEHPDVAQDTIECRIDYNTTSAQQKPQITIDDVTVGENAGVAVFTVTLFPPASEPVTVDFVTQDGVGAGGAIAPQDYISTQGTLTFAPGETTQPVSVSIVSDAIAEDNEAFKIILSNATNADIADSEGIGTIIDAPLLDTLVRFDRWHPEIASDLKQLEIGEWESDPDAFISINNALTAFSTLATDVATAWENWQPVALAEASRADIHYNIDEDLIGDAKTVTIAKTASLPDSDQQILEMELPGYELTATTSLRENNQIQALQYSFIKLPNAVGTETFGESSLPDRKVTVIDLDVLQYQNAWAAIRLARNKNLVKHKVTNPAFIFQTPEVRFKNRITPLIINDKDWDIAALQPSSQRNSQRQLTLSTHLQTLFSTLLPAANSHLYDLRIACQYAFALALGNPGSGDDLLTSLPVLLTSRFTVKQSDTEPTMLAATAQLRRNLVREIEDWQIHKRPNRNKGRYLFSISLFSHAEPTSRSADNPNLPLLKVERLWLALADISE